MIVVIFKRIKDFLISMWNLFTADEHQIYKSVSMLDKKELCSIIDKNNIHKAKNTIEIMILFKIIKSITSNILMELFLANHCYKYYCKLIIFLITLLIENNDEDVEMVKIMYDNHEYLTAMIYIICNSLPYIQRIEIGNYIFLKYMLYKIKNWEFEEDKIMYGTKWADSSRILSKSTISEYWREHGLYEEKLKNISIIANNPDRIRSDITEGFELAKHVDIPEMFIDKGTDCGFARQDDYMHVMAIYKRLASDRFSPTAAGIEEMKNIALERWVLNTKQLDYQECLLKAIGTKGTAGQWSKKTIIDSGWKSLEDPNCIKLWESITIEFLYNVIHALCYNETYANYSLYRKVEVLPLDDKGEIKITRLIQAASLPLRMSDSVVFTEYNEAFVNKRLCSYSDIGLRIERELVMFINPFTDDGYLICDFSDFDGHQHPLHMNIGKLCRMMSNMKSTRSIHDKVRRHYYLKNKYRLHMTRRLTSTWGINIQMYGTLASGDIVTSDDNTLKTASFLSMVEKRIKTIADQDQRYINYKAVGDDVKIRIGPKGDYIACKDVVKNIATSLGYNLKECIFYNSYKSGDICVSLGHSIETILVEFIDNNNGIVEQMTFPILTRPDDRLWTKFLKSAEIAPQMTYRTKQIQVSKMISYIIMLWGMPEVELLAFSVILQLGVYGLPDKEYEMPYTWRDLNIDTTTISENTGPDLSPGLLGIQIKKICNMFRVEEQKVSAIHFIDIVRKHGIKIELNDVINKGWYERQKVYDIISKVLATKKIKIKRAEGVDQHNILVQKVQTCAHINSNHKTNNWHLKIFCGDCIATESTGYYPILDKYDNGIIKIAANRAIRNLETIAESG